MDDTLTGKLIVTIMFAFPEFKCDMIVEQVPEGRAIARKHPNYHEGRLMKYSKRRIEHALNLLKNYSYYQVVELMEISKIKQVRKNEI